MMQCVMSIFSATVHQRGDWPGDEYRYVFSSSLYITLIMLTDLASYARRSIHYHSIFRDNLMR